MILQRQRSTPITIQPRLPVGSGLSPLPLPRVGDNILTIAIILLRLVLHPPWGLAIYNAVTALQVQVTTLQVQVTTTRQWADDVIQWPQHGAVPLPAIPNTVEEQRSLGLGPCGALLAYYGLLHCGSLQTRACSPHRPSLWFIVTGHSLPPPHVFGREHFLLAQEVPAEGEN